MVFCPGCREVLQEVQADVRGRSRQELLDPVLRHELDHGQAALHGEEVADFDRGLR